MVSIIGAAALVFVAVIAYAAIGRPKINLRLGDGDTMGKTLCHHTGPGGGC